MQNNDRLVQLTDANGNDIYPVTINPDDIARIEMTQTDPGEGSPLAANHFVAVYGASSQVQTADIANNAVTSDKIDFTTLGGNYSLSEQDTGFTWIDGRHIYKKTVDTGALPNTGLKQVAHGISNFDHIVRPAEGWAYRSSDNTEINIPFSGQNGVCQVTINETNIVYLTTASMQNFTSSYMTLYYVKTS